MSPASQPAFDVRIRPTLFLELTHAPVLFGELFRSRGHDDSLELMYGLYTQYGQVYSTHMDTKDRRFEFRLTNQELTQLRKLAKTQKVSTSDYIRAFIRRSAQKSGLK